MVAYAWMRDTRHMEPVLWLVTPLLVTSLVAVWLIRKSRHDQHPNEQLQNQQLQRMESALRQPSVTRESQASSLKSQDGHS